MSKIVILTNSLPGLRSFRLEVMEKFRKEGHSVCIYCPECEETQEFTEIGCEVKFVKNIQRRGTSIKTDIKLFLEYFKILGKEKPDMVFSYTIKPNIYGALACAVRGIPCAPNITGLGSAVENGGKMQKLTVLLYKIGFVRVKKVFFQNQENMDFFVKKKIALGKHELLPGSGVNLEKFQLLPYPEKDTVEFAFISRIMKEKGADQYLEAAQVIKEKYPNTVFHVCGNCEEAYQEKLSELHDKDIINYHGRLRDIREIHKEIHCTIHPTYYPEGMSNVLLESCASGRAIITTNRSGCREIVDDGINGFVVQQKNTQDVIEKIEKFLSLSFEERKQMGLRGREKVEKEFDRNIVIEKYMEVLYEFRKNNINFKEEKMKKLAIICGTLHPGGAERVISIISEKLSEKYDVEIILYYDRPVWYDISDKVSITIIDRQCKGKSIIGRAMWLRKHIKKNADVVLSFLAPFNIFTLISAFGVKIPKIVADRNDPRCVPSNKLVRILRNFMYRFATSVVVQNESNRKYFCKSVQKKCSVIFNPVDFQSYKGVALETEKENRIVSVGRLIEQKNNKMLLRAFANISEEFPNHKLVFYGEGNMQKALEEETSNLNISEKVIFAGNVKNVIDNIKDAELYVMTSNYEGMPNALLEAMCAGLPVISTKVSGAVDVIEDGVNGCLVDVNDVSALAQNMRKFLEDKEYATQCAENAVRISKLLDKEEIVQQWIDVIEGV